MAFFCSGQGPCSIPLKQSIPESNAHGLGLTIVGQRRLSEFPSDPTLLVPAERQRMVQHVVLVDPHGPGPQGIADSDGGVQISRVNGAGETVSRRVSDPNGVFLGLEFGDGADGAEDFFLHDFHVLADVREDGRLDEVAFFAMAVASDFHLGAFFLTSVNVAGIYVSRGSKFDRSEISKGETTYPMMRSYCNCET